MENSTCGKATIRLQLDVTLDSNGEDHEFLANRMADAFKRAIENGALSGDTKAEVHQYGLDVKLIGQSANNLNQKDIANWISEQIESGNIKVESLAMLMARYAIEDPCVMREEFAERMGLS